jgi:putative membrane protein
VRRPVEFDPSRAVVVDEPRKLPPTAEVLPPRKGRFRLGWWWFWAGVAGVTLALLVADAINRTLGWMATQPLFGYPLAVLLAATLLAGLIMLLREVRAVRKLGSLSEHRADVARLLTSELHGQSAALIDPVIARLEDRPALVTRFREHDHDALADGERLKLFERTVVVGMDDAAYRAVVKGSRDIGVLTALSPLGLFDAALVLWRTMAMLREVARAYGVPLGAAASTMLLRRAVRNVLIAGLADLVTQGAAHAMGAGFLRLISAQAGQGATNAMLAARLGCEAMTVVRPMPFVLAERPSLKRLAGRILAPAEGTDATIPPPQVTRQ